MRIVGRILLKSRRLMFWTFLHGMLTWAALALSYNSYKEYVHRISHTFPMELKHLIKSSFPWSILIFMALYILYSRLFVKKDNYSTIKQYALQIGLYTVIINLVFFSKGSDVLIVLNLSALYLVVFFLVWKGLKSFVAIDTSELSGQVIPQFFLSLLRDNMPKAREYCKTYPSTPFILVFTFLLFICAVLTGFELERVSKEVANIAYLFLFITVGVEIHQLIKGRNDDTGGNGR